MVKPIQHHNSTECQEQFDVNGMPVAPDLLREMLETTFHKVMEEEICRFLGAKPYERNSERCGMRNGAKPRTFNTRVGKLQLRVPQTRDCSFHPTLFERYQRSEKALLLAMQEMYIQGVYTRDVTQVLEQMGGFSVSPATVSRACAELDEQIREFRTRALRAHTYPYLIVDARYEKVRRDHQIESTAVLVITGVSEDGRRDVLGYWVGDTESELTWGEAFKDLKSRGLSGVKLIVSDAHAGLLKAMARHMQNTVWQRCRAHFIRDLLSAASFKDRKALAKDIASIFTSDTKAICLDAAQSVAQAWERKLPKMAAALRSGVEDTLAILSFPKHHHRRLYTTNMIERQNREFRRRSRNVSIFPNEGSLLRLFGAMCMELSEKWQSTDRPYLDMQQESPVVAP